MNDQQLLRFSRQIMLEDFDYDGQQALLDSTVLIVGLGGLGCERLRGFCVWPLWHGAHRLIGAQDS